jgi:hypothetical protein
LNSDAAQQRAISTAALTGCISVAAYMLPDSLLHCPAAMCLLLLLLVLPTHHGRVVSCCVDVLLVWCDLDALAG